MKKERVLGDPITYSRDYKTALSSWRIIKIITGWCPVKVKE